MSAERIWALTSGYPRRLRANKVLVFLQAFIDDSVAEKGDGRLFMAGYINTTENWGRFSDDWDKVLSRDPKIDYLRMAEANSLRGQFRGWDDIKRDLKLAKLAKVIRRHKADSFHYSINRAEYLSKVKPVASRGLGSAHYVATFGIVVLVTQFLAKQNFSGKVDFIFDQQSGVSADIHVFFDHIAKQLSEAQRAMIARVPQFGDGMDYLPLQAADMLAWHIRRDHERGDANRMLLKILPEGRLHAAMDMPDHLIDKWRDDISLVPGANLIQSKGRWQSYRIAAEKALAAGYLPPAGTKWRNLVFWTKQGFRRWWFNRRRR